MTRATGAEHFSPARRLEVAVEPLVDRASSGPASSSVLWKLRGLYGVVGPFAWCFIGVSAGFVRERMRTLKQQRRIAKGSTGGRIVTSLRDDQDMCG